MHTTSSSILYTVSVYYTMDCHCRCQFCKDACLNACLFEYSCICRRHNDINPRPARARLLHSHAASGSLNEHASCSTTTCMHNASCMAASAFTPTSPSPISDHDDRMTALGRTELGGRTCRRAPRDRRSPGHRCSGHARNIRVLRGIGWVGATMALPAAATVSYFCAFLVVNLAAAVRLPPLATRTLLPPPRYMVHI